MNQKLFYFSLFIISLFGFSSQAQITIPGDSIVYGPMFSPVYNNSIRVWVLTKNNTGSGETLTLSFANNNTPTTALTGTVYNNDTRLGYNLRSYEFTNLTSADTYTAKLLANSTVVADRETSIVIDQDNVTDFEFLSGGCGRIYDLTRCIDLPESAYHFNGSPTIFNKMAEEGSDMMVWLGDATYLLGLQHANGQCPNGVDDWANKDMAFDRYRFQRDYHDSLLVAMPQLAITDNHDLGPNEFDKNMPTINETREIFMDWWPNPEYKSTAEGQGLYSSYQYKDVEYFLLDNRSYRDGTQQHLGPDQLDWLKTSLLNSTATFKVLINGTPSFKRNCGGRNFCNTAQATELIEYVSDNNINGLISFSADVHEQMFMVRDGDVKYPLIDVLSGNLNSDVGNGNYYVNYGQETILQGVKQTYLRVNVFGDVGDRRMKVEYVGLDGQAYFQEIIHEDMLTSQNSDAHNLALPIENTLEDNSLFNHTITSSNISFANNRDNEANEALELMATSSIEIDQAQSLKLHDKSFSLSFWVNPSQLNNSVLFSNQENNRGLSFGITANGNLYYEDHNSQITKTSQFYIVENNWSFVTWKYDNVQRVLSLYYNGFLIESFSDVASSKQAFGNLRIGENFEGLLDEFNLYARLISDQEIMDLAEVTSLRGEVLNMPGSQNMAIEGNIINTVLAEDFTIQFWAKLNSDPGNNYKVLASNGRVNNNTTGISFEYPSSNQLNIVAGTNGSGWNAISNQGDIWNVGEWNHVTVTAVKNDSIKYYLNGAYVAGNPFVEYVPNSWGLGIGDSPSYGSDIDAEMDELRIWKRALTPIEIKENMHYPLTGTEQDLAIYYDFETSTTDITLLEDKGSEAYDITLDGATLSFATSPVSPINQDFQTKVVGQWSKNSMITNNGLETVDVITSYINNMVIGKSNSTAIGTVPNYVDVNYLEGGWQIDPLNLQYTSLNLDLEETLSNTVYDSISQLTQEFYLVKQDTIGSSLSIASQATVSGNIASFNQMPIETGFYYLAWGDSTLAQDDFTLSNLSLYPNPTSSNVIITGLLDTQNIFVEVYDLLGRTYKINTIIRGNNSIEVDLSSALLNNNLLILIVNKDGYSKTFKVLKK
ncbi:Por secretion system C-terminal sorting domain-containing protein [Mesonia phycicola]|uniref:Por secretion system C-terminal sorting domain-containing protein n=1 Tax=Mesonia phycicola TaxID=579105 RepID=A0A1M6FNQ3_9FLAO|nr:LamG-like jellyroll fold domain-containing protein [Mesonia phycicola]SHI99304.1 Por secretion system C-terminal sorting domain-containing protein [Mesonia phycicola]